MLKYLPLWCIYIYILCTWGMASSIIQPVPGGLWKWSYIDTHLYQTMSSETYFFEYFEEMLLRYYMDNDAGLKYSTTHWCVTRLERVKENIKEWWRIGFLAKILNTVLVVLISTQLNRCFVHTYTNSCTQLIINIFYSYNIITTWWGTRFRTTVLNVRQRKENVLFLKVRSCRTVKNPELFELCFLHSLHKIHRRHTRTSKM